MAVNNVSVTVPTAVSVGSKVDIVCSWDNGDSPPRHPVVRLTGEGGWGWGRDGEDRSEADGDQPKPEEKQTANKKEIGKQCLKITIPFCFVGHIHEVKSQPLIGERL